MARAQRLAVLIAAAALIGVASDVPVAAQAPAASVSQTAPRPESTLARYCVSCHNERLKTGGLMLDKMDLADIPAGADVWEKVIRKVRAGMMPPPGMPRPDEPQRQALVTWLERTLDTSAAARPNPGRALIHRLNRAEYSNTIRDLVGLDVDPSSLLPPDDAAYGFDNIADALGVSPILLERYLSAAGKIAALAVGNPRIEPQSEIFRIRQDASQDVHVEGLPIGTVGGLAVQPTIPLDAEYRLQVKLYRTNTAVVRGLENSHQLEVTVDGARVLLAAFGGEADFKASMENPTTAGDEVEKRLETRIRLKAGPHVVTAAFLATSPATTVRLQPFVRSSFDTLDPSGYPHIESLTVSGPFNTTGVGDTLSRRKVFLCRPSDQSPEEACVRRIVSTLARHAYRRPVTRGDIEPLIGFYHAARAARGFEGGIEVALQRILTDPELVFRAERDPEHAPPGTVYAIGDLELASRLSFFLWSSIPDEHLLRVAEERRLHLPSVLGQEVKRMLIDPKSDALVKNFAGQWLYLRNLKNQVPNSYAFPDFDDNLRQSFRRETELLFESVMREDRSVVDLMTADYTFVNERLARHYGLPNIYGSRFRRVHVADPARKGLLGQGSILMVTSHADRTSPPVRGKWILDNLLGTPPPAPPANVPPLKEDKQHEQGKALTMRERMEEHRANPACAACHKIMDPIGFALENFDAVGAWRLSEGGPGGTSIDASGQLMDGTKVDGAVALREALIRDPENFVRTMTEKLLTYALGRGLSASDMPVVRGIVRASAGGNYRFSSLVSSIVSSTAFRLRTAAPRDLPGAVARSSTTSESRQE